MKVCLVGSLPPFKDGIADHNYYLFKNLINNKDDFYILPSLNEDYDFPRDLKEYITTDFPYLENKKIDIYHLQFGNSYPNSYVFKVFNLIKNKKVKIIVTLHDTTNTNLAKILRTLVEAPKKLKYEFDKPNINEIVTRADKIIVYSEFLKEHLEEQYNVKNKVFVSYIGANTTTTDNKSKIKKNKKLIICTYGSVTPRKGIEAVILALQKLKQKRVDFKFYILGSFNFIHYKLYLKYLIKKLKLENDIILLGYQPFKEVVNHLKLSDIIIQPRLYSNEGASASLATVMLSGTPLIVTDIGSLSEYIIQRKTGLLVKHTPEEYLQAIMLLNNDSKLRASLAKNAQEWAIKNLSWKNVVEKQYKLYLK